MLYAIGTLVLRGQGITDNVLYADDFLFFVDHSGTVIHYDICRFPAQDYRWLLLGSLCISSFFPDAFALSFVPKLVSSLALAGFSFTLFFLLRKWGLSFWSSFLVPLVFLFHPTLNEPLLWNTTWVSTVIFLIVGAAYLAISLSNIFAVKVLGFIGLAVVSITYEYALIVFLVLSIAETLFNYLNSGQLDIAKFLRLLTVFTVFAALYIIQSKLTALVFPDPFGSRGGISFAEADSLISLLLTRARALLNVVVNVYMTPLSFYIPLEHTWSLWKWLPILMALCCTILACFVYRLSLRALLVSLLGTTLPFIPIMPLLVSSESPESWRVALPCVLGAALVYAIIERLTGEFPKALQLTSKFLLLSIIAVLTLTSYSEANLRSMENRAENSLLANLKSFWQQNGFEPDDIAVSSLKTGNLTQMQFAHKAASMSVAYHKRGVILALANPISWRGKLLSNEFKVFELQNAESEFKLTHGSPCVSQNERCALDKFDEYKSRCENNPDYVDKLTNIKLIHDIELRRSVICI